MAPRTGAKLAILALLGGGSLFAQQPQAPFKLAVPPSYQQRAPGGNKPQGPAPGRPAGTINPSADRAPISGSGTRVMYFHKPANSLVPDSSPDLIPVEAQSRAAPGVIPSVLPESMSPQDMRLAQAPPTMPRSVNVTPSAPMVADTPVSRAPAAARAEETAPAYLPMATSAPYTTPGYVKPPSTVPMSSTDMLLHTSQRMQEPGPTPERTERERVDREKATRLPARDKIFVIYNDSQLEQAIITSVKNDVYKMMQKAPGAVMPPSTEEFYRFPELSRLVPEGTVYQAKTSQYPPRTECFEPPWVVHRRLHFEQKNPERGGWDLGIAQPVVSTLVFYKDVLFWPHSLASGVHTCWDTSAGKCLPGSPTPFYLYPPEITVTGSLAEIVLVTATVFIFP